MIGREGRVFVVGGERPESCLLLVVEDPVKVQGAGRRDVNRRQVSSPTDSQTREPW